MAKIQYIPPTSPPDLLASAHVQGISAGAAVGRNRAQVIEAQLRSATAMAEIAMRGQIANMEAALQVRDMDTHERIALSNQKHDMEVEVNRIAAIKQEGATNRQFEVQQQENKYNFEKQLLEMDPVRAAAAARNETIASNRELMSKFSRGEITEQQLIQGMAQFIEDVDDYKSFVELNRTTRASSGDHPVMQDFLGNVPDTDMAGRLASGYYQALPQFEGAKNVMMAYSQPGSKVNPELLDRAYTEYKNALGVINSLRRLANKPEVNDVFTKDSMESGLRSNLFEAPPAPPPEKGPGVLKTMMTGVDYMTGKVAGAMDSIPGLDVMTPEWHRGQPLQKTDQFSTTVAQPRRPVIQNPQATHTVVVDPRTGVPRLVPVN